MKPTEINWKLFAKKLTKYRVSLGLDRRQMARKLNVSNRHLSFFEGGLERKKFGAFFELCKYCQIDPLSVMNSNLPHPLKVRKGAGIRKTDIRKNAEDEVMNDDMIVFVMCVDDFKRKNKKNFTAISEIYQLVLYLGYRKVVPKAEDINCVGE